MKNTMRDIMIEEIYHRMKTDDNIFFLSADFGSPKLDLIRNDPKINSRFINLGIAEQNLMATATGQSLEGFTTFAYGISAFVSLRCLEQIRNNLAIMGQIKQLNVNIISVGAGLSYDLSGPSHNCLEDLSIIRTLPNIDIISPSDNILVKKIVDYSLKNKRPKYIRLDSKPLNAIYSDEMNIKIEDGFYKLRKGNNFCIISTGFMTHTGLKVADYIEKYFFNKIGLIDIFMLRPLNENKLFNKIKNYKYIITMEEGFINKGGLDSLISSILDKMDIDNKIRLKRIGFEDRYEFRIGNREYLHKLNRLDEDSIINIINNL